MSANGVITVSQLNFYVKSLLDGDEILNQLFISGEISNLTDHYRSGHIYLSLKDEKAVIKCVMFAGNASRLRFKLENGMKVIASGRVSLYEATGQYQFYIEQMQPDGAGALALAFEQTKNKLQSEGIFDKSRKKPLPAMPKAIGVITSSTGAARRDIEQILARRYPMGRVILYPALVQGEKAPSELIKALDYFENTGSADVIIIGRGGGSAEDLLPFNDEELARKIAASSTPVVSAVGHETDFSICDFAADLRAPTPSAAAELVSPDISEMKDNIKNILYTINYLMENKVDKEEKRLEYLCEKRVLSSPLTYIDSKSIFLDNISNRLNHSFEIGVNSAAQRVPQLTAKLDVLSPLKLLANGYLTAENDGKIVKSVNDIHTDNTLKLTFCDGNALCTVKEVNFTGKGIDNNG